MKASNKNKVIKIAINVVFDIILAGVGLLIFAFFHHVLPQSSGSGSVLTPPKAEQTQNGVKISINNQFSEDNTWLYTTVDLSDGSELKSATFNIKYQTEAVEFIAVEEKPEEADVIVEKGGSLIFSSPSPNSGSLCKIKFKVLAQSENPVSIDQASAKLIKNDGSSVTPQINNSPQKNEDKNKFSDKFTTGEIIKTENSYKSSNINITLEKKVDNTKNGIVTYFVADVYLKDVKHFKTALANETYGKGYRQPIEELSNQLNGIIAVNGDYYGARDGGVVIRNGILYRQTLYEDICVLYMDGTMETFEKQSFNLDAAQATHGGIWQAWSFGPELLKDGQAKTSFNSKVTVANPRTAIGYYEPGHYSIVLVEGRQEGYSVGYSMSQLSQLFYDMGCKVAYNLDGGQSSVMAWDGKLANQPVGGGRSTSDALVITEE